MKKYIHIIDITGKTPAEVYQEVLTNYNITWDSDSRSFCYNPDYFEINATITDLNGVEIEQWVDPEGGV